MTTVYDDTTIDEGFDDADLDRARPGAGRRERTRVDRDRATRSRSAQRAIDRRRRRIEREHRAAMSAPQVAERPTRAIGVRRATLRERVSTVPFVVPVIALLVVGLGLSLWLSTRSAQDSYRIGIERDQNQSLLDRRDALKRTFDSGDSAPELSDKASRLGMIPAQNPARMVVDANGRGRMIGDPTPAEGKAMGSINPSTQPDPAKSIDTSKVDDSRGLGGDAPADPDDGTAAGAGGTGRDSAAADPGGANSAAPQDSIDPGGAAPTSPAPDVAAPNGTTPGASVAPGAARQGDPNRPAPNVLPPNGNSPGANAAPTR
ncbi:hypothetical protein [Gordonia soli]|uniref:Cell division protein FtsL n=1 Tax=Gordonia soli NBRC 108243 TaxID=1223545 RepID=M0QLU5_9ACTN|nr:hypothetical protein [Gordonia soli]GAC69548.1 hypothetical protein GS4_25_01200 [Gordonia soli NBRC 108243]